MSEKVLGSRFASDINQFVNDGRSSRFISKWLSERGESISHVTLSEYRKHRHQSASAPVIAASTDKITGEADLVRDLLKRVIENRDNPSKLKTYLEAYLRISDKARGLFIEPASPSTDSMKEDFELLRAGQPTEKLKRVVYWILSLRHPYWGSGEEAKSFAVHEDYRRWTKVLTATIEPLFRGENPLASGDLLSGNTKEIGKHSAAKPSNSAAQCG